MTIPHEIRANNSRLLYLVSDWLNKHEDLIDAAEVAELSEACGVDAAYAYALLLAAAYGFEVDENPAHRRFFEGWLLPMLSEQPLAPYVEDAYYQSIKIPTERRGSWQLRTQLIQPCQPFVCNDMLRLDDGRVLPQIGFFTAPFPYPAVLEDDREWMTLMPNETISTLPAVAEASGRVLTYGLGLGYFSFMAANKPDVASVTVVERDPQVIALFRKYILPQFPQPQKIRIIEADAFEFAAAEMPKGEYDFVFADIWHDVGDGLPLYRPFKELEPLSPHTRYMYWIEPTMLCYEDDSLWAE